jgi:hypothetical protein
MEERIMRVPAKLSPLSPSSRHPRIQLPEARKLITGFLSTFETEPKPMPLHCKKQFPNGVEITLVANPDSREYTITLTQDGTQIYTRRGTASEVTTKPNLA